MYSFSNIRTACELSPLLPCKVLRSRFCCRRFWMESPNPVARVSSSANGEILPREFFLFEVAWEVANKVGGIYTVIRSKAPCTVEEYGENFCLLGPYFPHNADAEFEPLEPSPLIATVLHAIEERQGIKTHYGKWLVTGYPRAILFDIESSRSTVNDSKHQLFLQYGLATPGDDQETNNGIIFGYQIFTFFQELMKGQFPKRFHTIAQFHEWQVAIGLLFLAKSPLTIATVFTTHATLLGRYLSASGGNDFYNRLPSVDPDKEAGARGIYHRHRIEYLAANLSKVFTTVSDITAYEAEQILKRRPDRVTPNGLKLENVVALHEFQNNHALFKAKIHDFVRGHFHGYYDFDLDNTLYVFTAGRYEYVNKGVDVFLDALGALNSKLKAEKSKTTVIAFIIMPARTSNFNVETLKGQSLIRQVRESADRLVKDLDNRIFESLARGQLPDPNKLISAEEMIMLKRRILSLKRQNHPPIVTHNMIDDANDPILNHIRRLQLFNAPDDRVKIVFHPEFISSNNPLFGIEYDQFVRGCHLGIFPSFYEPWGYTPAECTVMGIPSVTSNLTGFANYMQKKVPNHEDSGIYVVDRRYRTYQESTQQLADIIFRFSQLNRRQRIEMRNRCERLSELIDWNTLGREYSVARGLSVEKTFGIKPPGPLRRGMSSN